MKMNTTTLFLIYEFITYERTRVLHRQSYEQGLPTHSIFISKKL